MQIEIFRVGDLVKITRHFVKSFDFQMKINVLKEQTHLVVASVRTVKRFPALSDDENNEYIQLLTFEIDGTQIEVPASCVNST